MVTVSEWACVWAWTSAGERCCCLFVFWTFVTGTPPVTGTTLFSRTTPITAKTPVLFSWYFIFMHDDMMLWKDKVGLITIRAHVFLTNTSQYFYLPKFWSAAMTYICLLRRKLDTNLLQVSVVSLRMYTDSHCMLTETLNRKPDILKVQT